MTNLKFRDRLYFEIPRNNFELFSIVKVRRKWACCKCNNTIPKNSFTFGSGWYKLCLDCGYKFSDEAIGELKYFIEVIRKNKKFVEKNKNKFDKNNLLVKL